LSLDNEGAGNAVFLGNRQIWHIWQEHKLRKADEWKLIRKVSIQNSFKT